jgi:hypothetical protein
MVSDCKILENSVMSQFENILSEPGFAATTEAGKFMNPCFRGNHIQLATIKYSYLLFNAANGIKIIF